MVVEVDLDNPVSAPRAAAPGPIPVRAAVIDIGSNAVRLAIYDVVDNRGYEVYTERARPQLGRGLVAGGRLDPERAEDALAALARFRFLATRWRADRLFAVATAAVRIAAPSDRSAFLREAMTILNAPVRVLSGAEEARFAAEGVLASMPAAAGMVADIGGLSLEIAPIGFGAVLDDGMSFGLGPLALAPTIEERGWPAGREMVDEALGDLDLAPWTEFDLSTLYGVGGAWRNIAACDLVRHERATDEMDGYAMPLGQAKRTLRVLEADDAPARELMRKADVSRRRQATLPTAAMVLCCLIETLSTERVVISTSGVRQGVLVNSLRTPDLFDRARTRRTLKRSISPARRSLAVRRARGRRP